MLVPAVAQNLCFDAVVRADPMSRLVMSTISKRKDKRFNFEAYYQNKSKTFWFGPLTIGTKAKHIDLVQRIFIASRLFPFWPKILGQSKAI
jgi:hypothetical protein